MRDREVGRERERRIERERLCVSQTERKRSARLEGRGLCVNVSAGRV